MRGVCGALLALLLLVTASCSDNGTSPGGDGDFLFQLTVQEPDGTPVPGLEATLYVPTVPEFFGKAANAGARAALRPYAGVRYDVAARARVRIQVFHLSGAPVKTLIDQVQDAGAYALAYNGTTDEGTALIGTVVLKCRYRALDEITNDVLYADSTYAVLLTGIDAYRRPSLGTTDAEGIVRTSDRLLFPGTYELPQLIVVDENAEEIGHFAISDSARVFLRDPARELEQVAVFKVGPGRNRFQLTWDPSKAAATPLPSKGWPDCRPTAPDDAGADQRRAPIPAPAWAFRVYPNPFN